MVTTRSLLVVITLIGCSNAVTAPQAPSHATPSNVQVVNATPDPLVFSALAAALAPMVDPIPEVSVSAPWADPLASGAARLVGEIPGREAPPGDGVAVYLYALTPDGRRAQFVRVEFASGQEIRRAGGRIVIRQLRP